MPLPAPESSDGASPEPSAVSSPTPVPRPPAPTAQEHRPVTLRARSPRRGRPDEVSPLDKRIIEHLQADGRRPFTQIAADLGVSEAAVRARTNRLIERGILQVVGVTDPLKLGFHQMAMIGIRCESRPAHRGRRAISRRCPRSTTSSSPPARTTSSSRPCARTTRPCCAFLAERLRAIDGVRETETFVYLRLVKQTYQYGTR